MIHASEAKDLLNKANEDYKNRLENRYSEWKEKHFETISKMVENSASNSVRRVFVCSRDFEMSGDIKDSFFTELKSLGYKIDVQVNNFYIIF